MSTEDNNNDGDGISKDICANCGKEGDLKACTACNMVKYCNRDCQIAHRPQHKKECKKRAAELQDELLFKQPPSEHGDCPICFLRLPTSRSGSTHKPCCGKLICIGCTHAPVYDHEGNIVADTCPFCRTPPPTSDDEFMQRMQKRVEARDIEAIFSLGCFYDNGDYGLRQNHAKALELYKQAGEIGHAAAYCKIGVSYRHGRGVEVDRKKAMHYFELAAMAGCVAARYNLGIIEDWGGSVDGAIKGKVDRGKVDRAIKHYMIAAKSGSHDSLINIRCLFNDGHATKDAYSIALRSYQEYLGEIKSSQRDEAAAFSERRYYESGV